MANTKSDVFLVFFGVKNWILDRQRRAKDMQNDGPLCVVNATNCGYVWRMRIIVNDLQNVAK